MKKIMLLCFSALAMAGNLSAQSNQPLELTLQQAIDIALDENPTIVIADLEIQRQTYVRRETLGNLYPTLDASGTYNRAIKKTEMGEGLSFEPDNTVTFAANLNLPLFAPGVYKTLRLNEEQMRAAVENARATKITLVNEVKKAYYNILLAEESLDVLYSSRETTSETVEDTRIRYQSGLASEYDLITAEVQLSNLQPTIIQTENSIAVAKKLLKMYLNLPLDLDIDVAGQLDDFAGLVDTGMGYVDTDVSENTDLVAMDIQIDILRRQLEVARTQRMPTLAAFGNITYSGRDPLNFGDLVGTGGGGTDSFFWTSPIAVGVTLSVPIFAGNKRINQEKQIKNNISQMRVQREYLEQSVNVQLSTAINDLITARETMKANMKTVSQAQRGYDISRTRYNAGMGTILEVNTAELSLTQAKLNYTQSIYDYLSAQADYEKIKGQEK